MKRRELVAFKLLTREEEIAAWERGDFNALAESVWPFVIATARKMASKDSLIYDELLSEAGLAIAHACKSYDAHKSRFITYACNFLRAKLAKAAKRFNRLGPAHITDSIAERLSIDSETNATEFDEDCQLVYEVMKEACSELEIQVVTRRASGEKLCKIAADCGLSRQRIQQIEARTIRRLRDEPSIAELID